MEPKTIRLFDNISKFLAAEYPADFATWLLGRNIPLTTLSPTELNVDPKGISLPPLVF